MNERNIFGKVQPSAAEGVRASPDDQRKKNHQRNFSQHDVAKKSGNFALRIRTGKECENTYSQLFCFTKLTHGFQFFHSLQGHIQTWKTTNCIGEICDLESIVKIASFAGYHYKSYYHNFPKIKKCINSMYMIARKRKCLPPFLYYLYNS